MGLQKSEPGAEKDYTEPQFLAISSSFNYDFQPPGFIPLHLSSRVKRVRRQTFVNDEGEDIDMWETPSPLNFTVESEDDNINEHCADPGNGSSTCKSEHTYYEMKIFSNNTKKIEENYVNMDEWLKRPEITGTPNYDQLISSYRKAAVDMDLTHKNVKKSILERKT